MARDPLRIAIDLTALLPEATGVDVYLRRLIRHLGRIDDQNRYRVYVNWEDRGLLDGRLPGNFAVLPRSARPRPARLGFQQILLPVAARRWPADVVHSPSFLMPLHRGRQRHLLTIYDMTSFTLPHYHIPLRRSPLYRRALLASIRRADLVTVPSRSTAAQIVARVPDLPAHRLRVVTPGIGEEFRIRDPAAVRREVERLRLPPSYILHVGTVEPRKNLLGLIEAYRRMVTGGGLVPHLVLVGRLGWDYREVLAETALPDLADRVHLSGYVPQSDLPWYYAGADLFVYPSFEEGFGFPPLEAMACGIPTVSSRSSALVENLEGAAELVRPDDVEALAAAMTRLLEDTRLRQERRARGLERAARFRWDETARQTLACYRSLAGPSASPT